MTITVRYAESDQDAAAIHRFLCIIAGPTLPGEIDPDDSIREIWRCMREDVALMAVRDGALIGTLGLICATSWWNHKIKLLANRWAFAIPGAGAWRPLYKEARAIGIASKMEVHIISEKRGKVTILNRSKLRDGPNPPLANQAA